MDPTACVDCADKSNGTGLSTGTLAEFGPQGLFDTGDFPSRWNCGTWSDLHGWLHIVADLGTWAAYMAIPAVLVYFLRKRGDTPFRGIFALFATFILACGFTHLLEAAMFWWPAYRLMGAVKLLTMLVSIATAAVIVPLVPKALLLKSPRELEFQVEQRTRELRANQAMLEDAKSAAQQAARAKSDFLASMSHEIRTPLAAILGFAELVRADPGRASEMADVVEGNGTHLLQVLNDILDLSKIEAGKFVTTREAVPVGKLLSEVVDLMCGQCGPDVELRSSLEPNVPEYIETDGVRLRQILLNVVGNALKFTAEGSVSMVARVISTDIEQLEILISDTGDGMTAAQASSVFESFEQGDASRAAHAGTGLGLTISSKFAHLLGGSLRIVQTAPGHGTTVSLTLPAIEATPTSSTRAAPKLPSRDLLAGRTVLVVDDTPDNRLLARRTLEHVGARVVEAVDGKAGLSTWLGMRDRADFVDLVLTDLNMPFLKGDEMATAMRDAGFEGLILALTADAVSDLSAKLGRAPFDGAYVKPIRQSTLLAAVASHLEEETAQGHRD